MAPSAANFASSAKAVAMLNELPPWCHGDPDIRAGIYCYAKESERVITTLDDLLAQFFPTRAGVLGLPWWERLVRLTGDPTTQTIEQRRAAVVAYLQKMNSSPSGEDWESNVTRLIGPGWTYTEGPESYTLHVTLPIAPTSSDYLMVERLMREMTPAHLDLILGYSGGFVLDASLLDQEPLI